MPKDKPETRIQARNRAAILDAALDVFSAQGFRGARVDQIAAAAGLSACRLARPPNAIVVWLHIDGSVCAPPCRLVDR